MKDFGFTQAAKKMFWRLSPMLEVRVLTNFDSKLVVMLCKPFYPLTHPLLVTLPTLPAYPEDIKLLVFINVKSCKTVHGGRLAIQKFRIKIKFFSFLKNFKCFTFFQLIFFFYSFLFGIYYQLNSKEHRCEFIIFCVFYVLF